MIANNKDAEFVPKPSRSEAYRDEVDEKNTQGAHRRVAAGQEIRWNYGRNNNSPATVAADE